MCKQKKNGSVEYLIALFILAFTSILIMCLVKIRMIEVSRDYIEDGLTAACLAASIIDIDAYSVSNNMAIHDANQVFRVFQKNLKDNLDLSDDFAFQDNNELKDKIDILEFQIYSVENNQITIFRWNDSLKLFQEEHKVFTNNCFTPNGIQIETSTIYCKIGFYVKSFLTDKQYIQKEECTDIKRNE